MSADDHQPTDHQSTPQSVIQYLRSIIERCRLEHRQQLANHYEECWLLAMEHIYGALPLRWDPNSHVGAYPPIQNRPVEIQTGTPRWRQEVQARPLKKIIGRDGYDDILECGHRQFATYAVDGAPRPKRRRCRECGRVVLAKKQAASVSPGETAKVRA